MPVRLLMVAAAAVAAALSGCGRPADNSGSSPATEPVSESRPDPEALLEQGKAAAIRKDVVAATSWYRKAAEAGSVEGMYQLGLAYHYERGIRADGQVGDGWLQKAATAGHIDAQVELLRQRYWWLLDVSAGANVEASAPEGLLKAVAELQRLSDTGQSTKASIELADFLFDGVRVLDKDKKVQVVLPQNRSRAIELLTTLAEAGNSDAQRRLLSWEVRHPAAVPGEREKWIEMLEKTSEPDDLVNVAFVVGWSNVDPAIYITPTVQRAQQDGNKAGVRWIEQAAQRGSVRGMYELGNAYAKGLGISKDARKAFELYLRAADQGWIDAQKEVARAYMKGNGVSKDWVKAFHWVMKAATHPTSGSTAMLEPQRWLAGFYAGGRGVDKDLVLAYAWANVAAGGDDSAAVEMRQKLESELTIEQVREAQALSSQYKIGDRIVRATAKPESGSRDADSASAVAGTGTGFFFSPDGHMLTNAHVIDGCKAVRIPALSETATVLVVDKVNDLGVVKVAAASPTAHATLQDGEHVQQGQDIVVFGYPLDGYLPASGNVTPGLVSALAGPGNNAALIQISAPVQLGNSGGPVLDRKGNVVGVVVAKANAIRVAKVTGDIPQNVNFAISVSTVRSFLKSNGLPFSTPSLVSFSKDSTELAKQARSYTAKLECLK